MPPGGSRFRNTSVGWITTETGLVASVTIVPPDYGTHLEIEMSVRSDTTGATIGSARLSVNTDTTAGNYHTQFSSTTNGAANVVEASSLAFAQHPTADCATGYFGWINVKFPFFRRTDRQKMWIAEWAHETVATNQSYGGSSSKRQSAGVGALNDAITSIVISPAANNWVSGCIFRYRAIP